MKVGLVARCDDKGLGHMTWDFHRWMRPDRTLVVRLAAAEAAGFTAHPDRYPDGLVVLGDRGLPEAAVRDWLAGLDVVYTAEVPYDWRLFGWARDAGVATVLHVMPEAWPAAPPDLPTHLWLPTTWCSELLPPSARLVPVPVEPRPGPGPRAPGEPLRVLHVQGNRAGGDRNGTNVFLRAVQQVTAPLRARIEVQTRPRPMVQRPGGHVDLQVHHGGRADRWAMYTDADLLVMPRRYGGLCLPVQEAMACGLGVLMTDAPPNPTTWPVAPIPARSAGARLRTPLGRLETWHPDPDALARNLTTLAAAIDLVERLQVAARDWAERHAWPAMVDTYRAELARAVEAARTF